MHATTKVHEAEDSGTINHVVQTDVIADVGVAAPVRLTRCHLVAHDAEHGFCAALHGSADEVVSLSLNMTSTSMMLNQAAEGTTGMRSGDCTVAPCAKAILFNETLLETLRGEGAHDKRASVDASDHEVDGTVASRTNAMVFDQTLLDTLRGSIAPRTNVMPFNEKFLETLRGTVAPRTDVMMFNDRLLETLRGIVAPRTIAMIFNEKLLETLRGEGAHDKREFVDASDHEGDCAVSLRTNAMIFNERLLETLQDEGAHAMRDPVDVCDREGYCAVVPRTNAMIFNERLLETLRGEGAHNKRVFVDVTDREGDCTVAPCTNAMSFNEKRSETSRGTVAPLTDAMIFNERLSETLRGEGAHDKRDPVDVCDREGCCAVAPRASAMIISERLLETLRGDEAHDKCESVDESDHECPYTLEAPKGIRSGCTEARARDLAFIAPATSHRPHTYEGALSYNVAQFEAALSSGKGLEGNVAEPEEATEARLSVTSFFSEPTPQAAFSSGKGLEGNFAEPEEAFKARLPVTSFCSEPTHQVATKPARVGVAIKARRFLYPSDFGSTETRKVEPASAGARRPVKLSDSEGLRKTSEVQYARCDIKKPQQRPASARPFHRRFMPLQVRPLMTATPPDIKAPADDCNPFGQKAVTVRASPHSPSPMVPSIHSLPSIAGHPRRGFWSKRAAGQYHAQNVYA